MNGGISTENVITKNNMASVKKKAKAKSTVKFRDLKSKKNPKGGFVPIDGVVSNPQAAVAVKTVTW